jgi:hypothetical protein
LHGIQHFAHKQMKNKDLDTSLGYMQGVWDIQDLMYIQAEALKIFNSCKYMQAHAQLLKKVVLNMDIAMH